MIAYDHKQIVLPPLRALIISICSCFQHLNSLLKCSVCCSEFYMREKDFLPLLGGIARDATGKVGPNNIKSLRMHCRADCLSAGNSNVVDWKNGRTESSRRGRQR